MIDLWSHTVVLHACAVSALAHRRRGLRERRKLLLPVLRVAAVALCALFHLTRAVRDGVTRTLSVYCRCRESESARS